MTTTAPPTCAPYGSWTSPVTARLVARHRGRPDLVGAVGSEVWWTEPRPADNGRTTLVRLRPGGTPVDALPGPWNVRSRVMEYGGTAWCGTTGEHGPLIVFANFADQRLYRWEPDAADPAPRPLTPSPERRAGLRYADLTADSARGEVRCVLEEFTGDEPHQVRRAIVSVPLDGSAADRRAALRELAAGHRFLTGPRLSPDGRLVAWLAWDHPWMPWDGTLLRLAEVAEDGSFTGARTVAGGPGESVAQVEWSPDGTLLAAVDRTGWWNIHQIDPATGEAVNLCPRQEEFAGPLWRPGSQWFAPLPDGRIAVLHGRGAQRLGLLDPLSGRITDAAGPWTEWAATLAVVDGGARVVGVAGSAQRSFEVVAAHTTAAGAGQAAGTGPAGGVPPGPPLPPVPIGTASAHDRALDAAYLPQPHERTFTGPAGRQVHAYIHPPRNPGFSAPEGELPPYVVWVHGGPTSRAPLVRDLETAYFTSRGIGVAVVNYGGSTGYGRAYRNRLREQWGLVDVEDCAAVARALAAEGAADPRRLAIRGGSAGGWTAGASITSASAAGVYRCAAVFFPVLDLENFGPGGTHDFEAHYMHSLVGPLPQHARRYRDRSPVRRSDRLTVPFLLLQGLDDAVCPPAQSQRFVEQAAARGIPHAYLAFEGEGHGFRKEETIIACLEAELSLYGQVFGFIPPGVPVLELRSAP